MHFILFVSALATMAIAAPLADLETRANDVCFRVQARCPQDPTTHSRWLEGQKIGDVKFDKDFKDAGLFALDDQQQLRNVYSGSYATRDRKYKKNYGEVEMVLPRKQSNNDKVTCNRKGDRLYCKAWEGDSTYAKGSRLIIGQDVDKFIYPVDLVVVEAQCPPRIWTTWS